MRFLSAFTKAMILLPVEKARDSAVPHRDLIIKFKADVSVLRVLEFDVNLLNGDYIPYYQRFGKQEKKKSVC
jgi:hypothetical protein